MFNSFHASKFKYAVVFVTVLIIVGWFYWFQYRPSEIKKRCGKTATTKVSNLAEQGLFLKMTNEKKIKSGQDYYDFYYKECLNFEGL